MFDLSIGSLYFFLFLILGPLFLRNNFKYRNYIFLLLNLAVYLGGIKYCAQAVVAAIWLILPFFAVKLGEKYKKFVIISMVCIFAYLMKYDFIFTNLHIPYIFLWKILGLSYFLFREIDFIMQYEYLKECEIRLSFVDYINYVMSFYTLLAGPIQRYEDFVTDFYEEKEALDFKQILNALNRVVNGYLKVFVVSAIVGHYADYWFDGIRNHSGIVTTIGAFVIFAFFNGWYIYFNFSGYCDVVIAFADLAGFKVAENFNRPYLSRNLVEFWNRHHITLSEWIRDYIYSPLFKKLISGFCSKNIKLGQYIALFLTFTIAGIWHGTTLNYVFYGLFQGAGLVVATIYKEKVKKKLSKEDYKKYQNNKLIAAAEICATWTYICLTFTFTGYDVVGLFL